MATPAEKRGYKIGDRFEVIEDGSMFKVGEIVELDYDDGSDCPRFHIVGEDQVLAITQGYCYLRRLRQIPLKGIQPTPDTTNKPKEKNMNKEELLNSELTDNKRILVEEGIMNRDGSLTELGETMVIRMAFTDKETEIVNKVKTIRKARKDTK